MNPFLFLDAVDDEFERNMHSLSGHLETLIITLLIVGGIIALLMVISMWRIFTKAGKPGWAAIVPIYNIIIMLEIAGKPTWWIILCLIPLVNIIVMIMVLNGMCKAFGKDVGYTIGLLLLPVVFYPLLAFSSSAKYIGPGGNGAEENEMA